MSNKLIIRAASFEAWFKANLRTYAHDIAQHGADSGFPFITYTSDTVQIFDHFADEIWNWVVDDAEDCGEAPLAFVAGFGRADMAESWDGLKNLLVWYACERVAREMTED